MKKRITSFAVERRLTPDHLAQFDRLLLNRQTRINDAMAWLSARGYRVGRTAVGNYRRHLLTKPLFGLRLFFRAADDRQARRQLAETAELLTGAELTSLTLFASFLESVRAADVRGNCIAENGDAISKRGCGEGVSKGR